ncbi:GAF domain-containing protein [Microbispora sp. GKU 823]|uniref:GAF domain-containing protein n=1 Tax=Microbispora sp. GKU 823 TaxID=1652100 RepID=UPI00117FA44B|nr:GAF domain-containing protein [Microbispora sp. GKU 823]
MIKKNVKRYAPPILFPFAVAALSAIAAMNQGPVRVYWTLGSLGMIIANGVYNALQERAAATARDRAIEAYAELHTTLFDGGQPLVRALGDVAGAESRDKRNHAISILINRTVALAQTELGRRARSMGVKCNTRAAFYRLAHESPDGNGKPGQVKLVREYYEGRSRDTAPRNDFVKDRSAHDNEAILIAENENATLVADLVNKPPAHFQDNMGRSYKSFIAVPVRACGRSYGLLTADSDEANSLGELDKGFLILMAGLLAAGLAQVESEKLADIDTGSLGSGSRDVNGQTASTGQNAT